MEKSSYKVTVIGAGAVGATLAQRIFEAGLADVVLVDILKNIACGKALDLIDAASLTGTEQMIIGTDDYKDIEDSDIVIITAGLPRKPGMSREDLIAKNAAIIRDVCGRIKTHAPNAIVIVVTNPLDSMTYLAWKLTGFPKERVFGMAGVLDGSRFAALLAEELKVPRSSIETHVLGSHGDTMVPVVSKTLVSGKPITSAIPKDALEKIVKRTRDRGAEIVSLLGTGSAYYSPSAAVFAMVNAILNDTKAVMTASALLTGEYGLKDIFIGVPCKIGRSGIEKIVELELSSDEKCALDNSAQAIKKTNVLL
jgi:malate dehydrogenase